MTPFSASDAALEGFTLIRRRWRVVLGWAGFNLIGLVMLVVLTVMLSLITQATSGDRRAVEVVASAVIFLGSLLLQAILAAAVFRLEFRPEEPAFLHLRLGRDELRLVLVWALTLAGVWAAGFLVGFLVGAAGLRGLWPALFGGVAGVYLSLRILLAAPIAFAERKVDFRRAWRLSRGRVLALLGMSALSFFLIALLLLVVVVALGLIAAGSAGLEGLAGLFGGAEALKQHPGLYLLEFAANIVLIPFLWVLGLAPAAAAYRALAAAPEPDR